MHVISVNAGESIVGGFADEAGAEEHLAANGWAMSSDLAGKVWTLRNWWNARVVPAQRSLSDLGSPPSDVEEIDTAACSP